MCHGREHTTSWKKDTFKAKKPFGNPCFSEGFTIKRLMVLLLCQWQLQHCCENNNDMNVVKEIERINKKELENGIYGGCGKGSWHDKYKDSAWVYVGGLSYELSEGDIICVMSQWGEIEDINLVREKGTNTSKGFAFVKYEDQRSTILAVDNFNGSKLLGRVLRVDHVDRYKLPKEVREKEEERLEEDPEAAVKIGPGHAYAGKELANEFSVTKGLDLWAPAGGGGNVDVIDPQYGDREESREKKHHKKKHKEHKEHKHKRKGGRSREKSPDRHHDKHRDSDRDTHHSKRRRSRDYDAERPRVSVVETSRQEVRGAPVDLRLPPDLAGISQTCYMCFLLRYGSCYLCYVCCVADTGAILRTTEAPAASWRGRRDPALATAAEDYARRLKRAEKEGGGAGADSSNASNRREEFAGFGGMNRRR